MSCITKFDTDFHADSVEWCPLEGMEEILACGTYQLNENTSIREGSFSLFKWGNDNLHRILKEETATVSAGVLDMKWKSTTEACFLSLATAAGAVRVFQLTCEENLQELGGQATDTSSNKSLCLSLDWKKATDSPSSIAVSDSQGQVSVLELNPTGLLVARTWQAHGYEAWIVCFGHDSNDLFSGGDDCMLHRWDQRSSTCKPVATIRWHKMGVCSLQMHPADENILASGSYDEQLVLWDIRTMSRPLKSASLGGGVWRIKWNMDIPDIVAAACMHNHFSIIDTHPATSDPMNVLCHYKSHSSLAYGIDWCRKQSRTREQEHDAIKFLLASCSFYDNALHIWETTVNTS